MRKAEPFTITALLPLLVLGFMFLFTSKPVAADSLRLLTDLEYEINNNEITTKATGMTDKTERTKFSHLYNLEIQKEIFPALQLNAGGLFEQDHFRNESDDPTISDSESHDTAIRPFLDLKLASPMLEATAGYRKSEIKQSRSAAISERRFLEEYSASLNWDPIDLPEVDLVFTRNLTHNEPLTSDQQVDTYQLRSRYKVRDFRINYNHTTNDSQNKISDFKTLITSDNGNIRFSRRILDGKVSLNASLRGRRQQFNFSGAGDRLVDTTSGGAIIGNADDPNPLSSDPDPGFDLAAIDLLVDSILEVSQFSFGLDFGSTTEVDRLLINFSSLGSNSSSDFSWRIYVRDNETDNWTQITPVQDLTNLAESRFELFFPSLKRRYIKIVTTTLAPPAVASGETLVISSLVAQRTLPADTSEFTSTDWTGDLSANWQMTAKTSSGFDILYRDQRSKPLDDKTTLLNTGLRLQHAFNDTFVGRTRLQRSETRKRGEGPNTNHTFSAAMTATYLETFDQSLIYSFSHQNDENSETSQSNAIFLRNNLDLYQGWSMDLDTGYSWQSPVSGADSRSTFVQVSNNIVPNRWMNFTLSYKISWEHEKGSPTSTDQDGRLVVNWVPTQSLSLSAELTFEDEEGDVNDSSTGQRYNVNWSPFRDGTLLFSLTYGKSEDTDRDEKIWNLSPKVRWQINPKMLLSLDYTVGERDTLTEKNKLDSVQMNVRFYY